MPAWRRIAMALCAAPLCAAVPLSSTRQDAIAGLAFTGYVVDQATFFTPAERRRLVDRLGRFQRATHHQIVVATVLDLAGEDIAAVATRLANRWGVGRRSFNDGVLLLIAPRQHGVRIAVGKGVERRLTNQFCQWVMDGRIMPAFRKGRFAQGIEAGIDSIAGRLGGAADPLPSSRP